MKIREKVLFVSNETFIDARNKEGGVQLCTFDFIALLKTKFDVVLFPVKYKRSLYRRIIGKFDLNNYHDYIPDDYTSDLRGIITEEKIKYIFLNLSNTMRFASLLKRMFADQVKIIICSHGNETGDYIHEIVKFKFAMPWFKRITSSIVLGRRLKLESAYRQEFIDMVLSVSPVEDSIEKWLGTKQTFMVPRTITKKKIDLKPVLSRVGFIGDLSHWPNKYGIEEVCKALADYSQPIELRLVGTHEETGNRLSNKYSFVNYLGFISNNELEHEAATWSFFLNPVFYYSKGVSTKLAKALGWGLPVISTVAGLRGYNWKSGSVIVAKDAKDMARLIIEKSQDNEAVLQAQFEVQKIVENSPSFEEIMQQMYPLISKL